MNHILFKVHDTRNPCVTSVQMELALGAKVAAAKTILHQ
jgi:hypothetical protein